MKTGLGIYRKLRKLNAYWNLFRFNYRKIILGFDVANNFIKKLDKISVQLILEKNGATIGKNCDIESGLIFHNCQNYTNLITGNNCHIGKNCFFDMRDKIVIYDNVVISMGVSFITHIDMIKSKLNYYFPSQSNPINVKSEAYIGANATILKGVIIKEKGFVAAGSIVNKNVESFQIVGGVPAKVIKHLPKEKI